MSCVHMYALTHLSRRPESWRYLYLLTFWHVLTGACVHPAVSNADSVDEGRRLYGLLVDLYLNMTTFSLNSLLQSIPRAFI